MPGSRIARRSVARWARRGAAGARSQSTRLHDAPARGESVEALGATRALRAPWREMARERGADARAARRTIGATRPNLAAAGPARRRRAPGWRHAARGSSATASPGRVPGSASRAARSRPMCGASACASSTTTATPTRASRATACGHEVLAGAGAKPSRMPRARWRIGRACGAGAAHVLDEIAGARTWPRRRRRSPATRGAGGALSRRGRANALRHGCARGASRRRASLVERLLDELPTERLARWPAAGGELRSYRGRLDIRSRPGDAASTAPAAAST